jgi:hypothetical protein
VLDFFEFPYGDVFIAEPWIHALQNSVTTNWVETYLARFSKSKPPQSWINNFNADPKNTMKISKELEIEFWIPEFFFILPSGKKIKKSLLFFQEESAANFKIYEVLTCTIH